MLTLETCLFTIDCKHKIILCLRYYNVETIENTGLLLWLLQGSEAAVVLGGVKHPRLLQQPRSLPVTVLFPLLLLRHPIGSKSERKREKEKESTRRVL